MSVATPRHAYIGHCGDAFGLCHLGTSDSGGLGVLVACGTEHTVRITKPTARVPVDDHGASLPDALLTALTDLAPHPHQICSVCFPAVVRRAYAWEFTTARSLRTVSIGDTAAALIALTIASPASNADNSLSRPTGVDAVYQVTVSGHADAVLSGLLAPSDTGYGSADHRQVWHHGIFATDTTWNDIHTAFPRALYRQWRERHSPVELDDAWDEVRLAFPLTTFRAWSAQADEFRLPDPTAPARERWPITHHSYDPNAGL